MKKQLSELAKYSDRYIAISDDGKIVAAGQTIRKLEKKLQDNKITDITIRYIAPTDKFLSPTCL